MNKKNVLIITGLFLLLVLFSSPFWLWQLKASENVNVLIIDKTVPDQSYREHKGLVWLLNHLKLIKDGGDGYKAQNDYVGFVPSNEPPKFDTRELPDDLSPYDVLYLADGYGVYKDEYLEGNQEGNRSELLYGGMTIEEVRALSASLIENEQTLIAEFNTFGSPTEEKVRQEFYNLLNIDWTGWMGRYFNELSNAEVPGWVKKNYEAQYGKPFKYTGNGFVFVNEEDQVVVLTNKDTSDDHALFTLTDEGLSNFDMDRTIQYNYWFDIVNARSEEEVQATFDLPLTQSGQQKLKEFNIPTKFPAVIHHNNQMYDSYYFAGDFVDQEKVPSIYQMSGLSMWQKLFSFEQKGRTDTFFWKAYVPMMTTILTEKEKAAVSQNAKVEPEVLTKEGMKLTGAASNDYLQVYQNGAWEDVLIKGVNMGIAKPGTFPGETGITKQEYARWFDQISEMNANALRVYTIHPPAFYQALYEHNINREDPLYLFHGVWVNEDVFFDDEAGRTAYDPEVMDDFKAEIQRTVDIIHGNADIEERTGHASGKYVHDLSPYLLGWIIGVEWDPDSVIRTNEKYPTKSSYNGKYMMTENASPFEVWLAEMMDYTASYEAENYQWQHPMSFANWVTTDLLTHPAEPDEDEDKVSINPNKIKAKDEFYSGLFASYHIYPYYPEFLNYEEKYVNFIDHRGEKNNYAGYLNDMRQYHDMPVVVAEYGIPASRGLSHENVHGFDQGHHSEQEQGQFLSSLYEDIVEQNMAGGLVFSWQDEWFKRTWNTMEYDNPDRRPYWDNIQTNEQHFGLLSFEPDTQETQLQIDGDTSDWKARNAEPVAQSNEEEAIKNVFMSSDERGLFIRIDYDQTKWNPEEYSTSILLNTIKNQGQSTIPNVKRVNEEGIDFVVEINGEDQSRVLVDSYYDTFYYQYGKVLNMIETKDYANKKNNGIYHPIRLTLNKELTINKEEGQMTVPFSSYETGKLTYGVGNSQKENSTSLADFYIKDGTLELRLPWLMINVKDPSQKEIMGDVWSEKGIASSEIIQSLFAKVVVTNKDQEPVQMVPSLEGDWIQYSWDNWDEPTYHERLKKSYNYLQETFKKININE
ncbi:hypothetical protein [Metabacillus litoralis]|uniref:hypothetical protein n=1 Tax=Metabacillus litoralis TaxID=152268 RepID=UPI002041C711|nr:hypothetical protein [Metabacillus litoralis]MCM3161098.1 hypothetical protein [Metabacillus litoralis]MCM3412927.1 hypothetical protein [Metabacillus litoralis]